MRLNVNSLNHLYTLNGSDSDPAYIVGPRHIRRMVDKASRNRCHELEAARMQHRKLDAQISELDVPRHAFLQPKLRQLKAEKLKLKDRIATLSRAAESRAASKALLELGAGAYGKIILAQCMQTKKEVAIKVASTSDYHELRKEYQVLQQLHEPGFPRVFYFGQQEVLGTVHVVMVMDVLGPSLERLLYATRLGVAGFGTATVLRLADQMLAKLECLSRAGIVHGDIQPGNFLMGKEEHAKRTIHLIDFGLSSMRRQTEGGSRRSGTADVSCSRQAGDAVQAGSRQAGAAAGSQQAGGQAGSRQLREVASSQQAGGQTGSWQFGEAAGSRLKFGDRQLGKVAGSRLAGGQAGDRQLEEAAGSWMASGQPGSRHLQDTATLSVATNDSLLQGAGMPALTAVCSPQKPDVQSWLEECPSEQALAGTSTLGQGGPQQPPLSRVSDEAARLESALLSVGWQQPGVPEADCTAAQGAEISTASWLTSEPHCSCATGAAHAHSEFTHNSDNDRSSDGTGNVLGGDAAAPPMQPADPCHQMSGTLAFSSSRGLRGAAAEERDDLESLAFCLAYLLQGTLPWSHLSEACDANGTGDTLAGTETAGAAARLATRLQEVAAAKDAWAKGDVCESLGGCAAAAVAAALLAHARSLPSGTKPDYARLRWQVSAAVAELGEEGRHVFDWEAEGISWSSVDGSLSHAAYH